MECTINTRINFPNAFARCGVMPEPEQIDRIALGIISVLVKLRKMHTHKYGIKFGKSIQFQRAIELSDSLSIYVYVELTLHRLLIFSLLSNFVHFSFLSFSAHVSIIRRYKQYSFSQYRAQNHKCDWYPLAIKNNTIGMAYVPTDLIRFDWKFNWHSNRSHQVFGSMHRRIKSSIWSICV